VLLLLRGPQGRGLRLLLLLAMVLLLLLLLLGLLLLLLLLVHHLHPSYLQPPVSLAS
jgi:hypothetical protein